jgi:hypothetical protein
LWSAVVAALANTFRADERQSDRSSGIDFAPRPSVRINPAPTANIRHRRESLWGRRSTRRSGLAVSHRNACVTRRRKPRSPVHQTILDLGRHLLETGRDIGNVAWVTLRAAKGIAGEMIIGKLLTTPGPFPRCPLSVRSDDGSAPIHLEGIARTRSGDKVKNPATNRTRTAPASGQSRRATLAPSTTTATTASAPTSMPTPNGHIPAAWPLPSIG